jgi:hypothetical protein
VLTEDDFDANPDPGFTREVWVWMQEHEGTAGPAVVYTTGGAGVPLLAPTERQALAMTPLAQFAVDKAGEPATLKRYVLRDDQVRTLTPREAP